MKAPLTIAAVLLVFSSAGFGCVYAWHQAAHHGPALAVLAVAMALGLEAAKPFAVEAVLDCMRRLAIGRALAMLVLATVCVGYSLTAELSLMASARADATAERDGMADARQKAADRYARAVAELGTLAPNRPVAELQALLAGKDCGRANGPAVRGLCAEHGRALRRAELQAVIDKAETDTGTRPAVGAGDAGAVALAGVLALMGWTMPAGALAPWLVLVGVLALEVGSSLAVVLARSIDNAPFHKTRLGAPPAAEAMAPTQAPANIGTPASAPEIRSAEAVKADKGRKDKDDDAPPPAQKRSRGRPATVLPAQAVERLRNAGGKANGSVRGVGKLLGASSKTAAHRLLHRMAEAGQVRLAATPHGISVALA